MVKEKNAMIAVADDLPDSMHCPDHPFRTNPGAVCPFCLHDKLRNLLLSSPTSSPLPLPFPSPPSPSSPLPPPLPSHRRPLLPFLHRRKKNQTSKFPPDPQPPVDSPRRRWFWPFQPRAAAIAARERVPDPDPPPKEEDRTVARSRSVGCGSRSFSGDFLERISTGLGDCTLRRAESHREAKPGKIVLRRLSVSGEEEGRRRAARCAGIFGGPAAPPAAAYWIPAAEDGGASSRSTPRAAKGKGWGWSPMRAFRPSARPCPVDETSPEIGGEGKVPMTTAGGGEVASLVAVSG